MFGRGYFGEVPFGMSPTAARTKQIALDMLLRGTDLKTVSLDVILSAFPQGAIRYILEVREPAGDLLAILNNAYDISYEYAPNEPSPFLFNLPADDDNRAYIASPNEVWLRDYKTGDLIRKFRLNKVKDTR